MNGRQNLYRLQHWQLAERLRYLGDLESLAERLRVDVEALNGEIAQAAGSAQQHDVRGGALPLFVAPLLERRDKLARSAAEIDAQIAEAREAVATAQQELRVRDGAVTNRGFSFEDRRVRRTRRSV